MVIIDWAFFYSKKIHYFSGPMRSIIVMLVLFLGFITPAVSFAADVITEKATVDHDRVSQDESYNADFNTQDMIALHSGLSHESEYLGYMKDSYTFSNQFAESLFQDVPYEPGVRQTYQKCNIKQLSNYISFERGEPVMSGTRA